jgi:para-nitrobenzyl esterase
LQRTLDAQARVLTADGDGFTVFSPSIDGDLFRGSIVAAAVANPAPLVLGTTRDEMALFNTFNPALNALDLDGARAMFAKRFGEGTAAALAAYAAARPGATPKDLVTAMQTDEVFRIPAVRVAERRAATSAPTWMYWFTWATPAFGGALGACHAVDIAFAFHNLARTGVEQFTGTGADRIPVADAYSGAILAFASGGDPGWARYEATRRATQRIDVHSETLDDPERALREVWARP